MEIEDKITIIEGPPPTFEAVSDGWVLGLTEGPTLSEIALTRVRTFNGPALVERCHRAWRHQQPIYLEFRAQDGLPQQAPIVAARHLQTDDGDMLLLWVRLTSEDVELELTYTDDELDDDDFDMDDDDDFDDDDFEDFLDDDDDDDFIDFDDLSGPRSLS
ncbi:MAG: hypothetical protein ACK2UW_18605 [Anaerolineales bacterium]